LLGSYYFYTCYKLEYVIIMIASTLITYLCAIRIEESKSPAIAKVYLYIVLIFNLGLLFFFKYLLYFIKSTPSLLSYTNYFYDIPFADLVLPAGISFYTFELISYTLDVYWGNQKTERHLGLFSLFIAFFPKLVAGPIERAEHLIPQFKEEKYFDYAETVNGINKILYGLFKKVVVADRLGVYVNEVFKNTDIYPAYTIIIAIVFFSLEVYADFSGYSDIALGSAQVLGIRLSINFDRPFTSQSVTEFWRRWHISLSNWIRDYVYTPIMMSTRNWEKAGIVFSLVVSFVICGVWHGANPTFLIFGLLHGIALSYEFLTKKFRKKLSKEASPFWYSGMSIILTFSFYCFSSIFFRAERMSQAGLIFQKIFSAEWQLNMSLLFANKGSFYFALDILVIFLLFLSYRLPKSLVLQKNLSYAIVSVIIILLLGKGDNNEFMYFQF
jgi:alginate O-acetyltransferase complex protein AlgI